MILTTHPPIFLPWLGFFCKAIHSDVMVLLDDVQFPFGRSWLTRNRFKSDKGELWLKVPVWSKGRGMQIIRNVEICNETNWRKKHVRSLQHVYANAPYLKDYLPQIETIYSWNHNHLAELNIDLIRHMAEALQVKSQLLLQSELGVTGRGTELLISICRFMGADSYITLPTVKKYLVTDSFLMSGIQLLFAHFSPPVYPQLWGDFRHNLSTLDLLFTCGPGSKTILAGSTRKDS